MLQHRLLIVDDEDCQSTRLVGDFHLVCEGTATPLHNSHRLAEDARAYTPVGGAQVEVAIHCTNWRAPQPQERLMKCSCTISIVPERSDQWHVLPGFVQDSDRGCILIILHSLDVCRRSATRPFDISSIVTFQKRTICLCSVSLGSEMPVQSLQKEWTALGRELLQADCWRFATEAAYRQPWLFHNTAVRQSSNHTVLEPCVLPTCTSRRCHRKTLMLQEERTWIM
mmetsp:Transcript_63532/g.120302  ORF Transcript_63532/g.120302 Transcript_63532/m.120302 type:complete len:226 (+) Transcript_63532:474-1151(+)